MRRYVGLNLLTSAKLRTRVSALARTGKAAAGAGPRVSITQLVSPLGGPRYHVTVRQY